MKLMGLGIGARGLGVLRCCSLSVSIGELTKQDAGGNFALGAGYCIELSATSASVDRSARLCATSASGGAKN